MVSFPLCVSELYVDILLRERFSLFAFWRCETELVIVVMNLQVQARKGHRFPGGASRQTVPADGPAQRGATHLLHGRRPEDHPGRARGRRLVRRFQLQNVQGERERTFYL